VDTYAALLDILYFDMICSIMIGDSWLAITIAARIMKNHTLSRNTYSCAHTAVEM
jgi:hypothetical protein